MDREPRSSLETQMPLLEVLDCNLDPSLQKKIPVADRTEIPGDLLICPIHDTSNHGGMRSYTYNPHYWRR